MNILLNLNMVSFFKFTYTNKVLYKNPRKLKILSLFIFLAIYIIIVRIIFSFPNI